MGRKYCNLERKYKDVQGIAIFFFFFVVEFKLFIDKKPKYNEKYQKKKFGLVFLVTLWNESMK